MPEYKTLGQYEPSNLLAGDFPIVTSTITITAGQSLTRGAVLGRIDDSDEYVLSEATATDGSENPIAILTEDVDSASGEIESVCYLSGQFNSKDLVFGAGHTAESTRHNLRLLNIYLTNTL